MFPSYDLIKAFREDMGAPWFDKPWDLNLVILRSGTVGEWDDLIVVACVDDAGREVVEIIRATGDAWAGEWTNPTHPDGCIYVLDQHVPGGLVIGEHKGRPALRQIKPFRYVRWPPGSGIVPTVDGLEALAGSAAFEGLRGTHVHNRHDGLSPARPRPNDSEGCTVSLYRHRHAALMELVHQQRRYRGSAVVSPTYARKSALLRLRAQRAPSPHRVMRPRG